MRNRMPLIHQKIIVNSTYCITPASIRAEKENFVRRNHELVKMVSTDRDYYISKLRAQANAPWTKPNWHRTVDAQKLEIKIRVYFGYSPRSGTYDILNHFCFIFKEINQWP